MPPRYRFPFLCKQEATARTVVLDRAAIIIKLGQVRFWGTAI